MIDRENLMKKLEEIDTKFHKGNTKIFDALDKPEIKKKQEEIEEFSKSNFLSQSKKMAVLGLDIFKYSEYEPNRQNLVPFIFDMIFNKTLNDIKKEEKAFFKDIDIIGENKFISTGDGGFILFDTPLHAIIFNLRFFAVLHLFNTGHLFPELSRYIGKIVIRSAITRDMVFKFNEKYYGKAIIDNSRILSRDRLDRFAISENVYDHFIKFFNGIENLPNLRIKDIYDAYEEGKRDYNIDVYAATQFFNQDRNTDLIKSIHVQKIERLISKNTELTFYNIEVQFFIDMYNDENETEKISFILSVGNLNANKLEQ